MTFTILWGWWLIPALITAASFIWYRLSVRSLPLHGGDYGMGAVAELFMLMMAAIPSLIAWLIWAVLT